MVYWRARMNKRKAEACLGRICTSHSLYFSTSSRRTGRAAGPRAWGNDETGIYSSLYSLSDSLCVFSLPLSPSPPVLISLGLSLSCPLPLPFSPLPFLLSLLYCISFSDPCGTLLPLFHSLSSSSPSSSALRHTWQHGPGASPAPQSQ